MILKNLTGKTILSNNLKEAKSFIDVSMGLLKKANPRSLLFKTRFGIHTFFLKKPIDVIILNSNKRIVKLKSSLKQNRIFLYNIKYFLVIELPEGVIKKSKTNINDQLEIL